MSNYSYITQILRTCVIPTVISCGVVLNLISFLVLKRIKSSSTAQFMSFLGLIDLGVLLAGSSNMWLNNINFSSMPIISVIGCKLTLFLFYTLADYSVLILVIMTVERFYGVWKPVHTRKSFTFLNLVLAFLFCCFVNSHFILTHTMVRHEATFSKNFSSSSNTTNLFLHDLVSTESCEFTMWKEFYEKYWIYIDATIYSFLPFLIISVCNTLIISCLNKAERINSKLVKRSENASLNNSIKSTNNQKVVVHFGKKRLESDSSSANNQNGEENTNLNNQNRIVKYSLDKQKSKSYVVYFTKKEPDEPRLNSPSYKIRYKRASKINSTRLIVMLITINVSFCLLSMPMSILQIVYYSYANEFALIDKQTVAAQQAEDDREALLELIDLFHAVAELLQFVNHGLNFILYSLSGKTFRNESKRFLCNEFNKFKRFFSHRKS